MIGKKFIKTIFWVEIILISTFLLSCVGTVKDKNAKNSNVQSAPNGNAAASFEGLQYINAISNDKVELFFLPASGDPANLTYEVYINNSPLPIKVTGRSLILNASGFYYLTITNLSVQTLYNFNMRVVEAGSETSALQLDNSKSLSTTTFSNETADFLGVSSLRLGAGENGKNSIIVKWTPATITGTNLNPRPRDPIGYQIIYTSQIGGSSNINNPKYQGIDKVIVQIPTSFGTSPSIYREKEYTISGLLPDTNYYVQVRAIHKGYFDYSENDILYKKELNTRFLKIRTLKSGALFDFNSSLVYLSNPVGEPGLSKLDVNWIPASGEFNHYRICFKQVAAPGGSEPIVDFLQDPDIAAILDNTNACVQKGPGETNYQITNLPTYAYYQVKVLACKNIACDSKNRIKSDLVQKRIVTNVAPFTGILSVSNPIDDTKLKEVTLNFDAPVTTAGYLNKFKLYCYNNSTDTAPADISLDGTTTSAGTGKTNCDGMKAKLISPATTILPALFSDYSSFNNLVIELPVINGTTQYCLSLVPSIYSTYLNQENKSAAVVKCFTPEIKVPTILEFPGRTNTCDTSIAKNVTIDWPVPTKGLYSKFVILFREKKVSSDLFLFQDAKNDYLNGKTNNSVLSVYSSIDAIDRADTNRTITGLVPGRTYSIGVLTYLVDAGGTKYFSQFNLKTGDCILPLPTPKFNEWVDIFAIGPKEDGLTPPKTDGVTPAQNLGARKYLLETLDDDSIPIEIALAANKIDPDPTNTIANSRLGAIAFNGVYGSQDSKINNATNQYSNSGIIRFGWKDVTIYSDAETLDTYIKNIAYEKTPTVKSSRNFGYRVYRSEDNKLTWIDLSKQSTLNPFQSISNQGLIHPSSFNWRKRNNVTPPTVIVTALDEAERNITFFTDYSVKFSGIDGEVDRARTYWYKVVPVFDGKELNYGTSANTNHHIIRVTLPPRNMALVHRMIANRTICLEMDKSIKKTSADYYSCNYNGLGSSGLQTPWTAGATVYDLGGDLLVDRFELSCPFSRGDLNGTNSDSEFDLSKLVFTGLSKWNNVFKGCYNDTNNYYEPDQGTGLTSGNYLYGQVIPGDCFGRDPAITASPFTGACSDPTIGRTDSYYYPGAAGLNNKATCTNTNYNGPNFSDMTNSSSLISSMQAYFPTQSEYAAVYYMRKAYNEGGVGSHVPSKIVGAGQTLTLSTDSFSNSCSVNLGYINAANEYRPRWLSTNSLFGRLKNGANTSINLYNKTIGEIRTDTNLYNTSNVKAPTSDLLNANRMTSTSTLARIATSNSAKLPPLDGMSQNDLYNLCSTYKVQVGVETSSKAFVALDSVRSKRIMRKKESIVTAAWPAQYDNTKVSDIENGAYTEAATTINNSCNTFKKTLNIGTTSYVKADSITALFPQSGKTNPLFMVGSSSRDPGSLKNNSEKCVSRFGVQDIVGNLKETNAEEIFCDFTQDTLYLGQNNNDPLKAVAVPYGFSSDRYNPNTITPWVLPTNASGSCSVNENGASKTGNFLSGAIMNSIYTFSGLDTTQIKRAKAFDQDSVLSSRNGDGSFLDFGQLNLGPSLSKYGSLSMEDSNLGDTLIPAMLGVYFNPALGMPLSCGAGCTNNGSDNAQITSEKLVIARSYNTTTNTLNMNIMNFPTNNSQISNTGVSEFYTNGDYDSANPDYSPINYVDSINLGADAADPLDNFLQSLSVTPPNATPGVLPYAGFKISRNSSLKMYTGGSSTTEAGRYSMDIDGQVEDWQRLNSNQYGGRCALMINND